MHPGVLSDLGRLKGLVIVLDSRVLWQERSTRKPLGRRWHWVLRFRSAERMLLRAVPQRQKPLVTSIVLSSAGDGTGGLRRRDIIHSTAELHSRSLRLFGFKPKHCFSADVCGSRVGWAED